MYLKNFYQNFESYIDDWDKSNAIYYLGNGVYYSLYTYSYHFNPEDTEFYNEVDSLFTAIANIGLYGTVTDQNEWLLNNAVWWNARIGLFDDEAIVVQFLTDIVIDKNGNNIYENMTESFDLWFQMSEEEKFDILRESI